MLASAAAAIGRPVVVFATNAGCRALCTDWSGLADAGRDAAIRATGVAGLEELREAARELGVRMLACEAGLRMAAIAPAALADGVAVAGVVSFLEALGAGQIVTL